MKQSVLCFFKHACGTPYVTVALTVLMMMLFTGRCVLGTVRANCSEEDFPFFPGEKLTFALKWQFVPAGEVVLEVLPIETVNGIRVRHFVMTTKTNSFVDLIYKVRQRIDAYADMDMNHSILYKEVHTMHKSSRDAVIEFDWKSLKAQYTNFGQKRKAISITPGAFDPLSIFYFARLIPLNLNEEIQRAVTDGKKCVMGTARVVKREKIKLTIGEFDTFLMEPDLKDVGGVFKKSKDAKIKLWVTADKRKIPVKLKSKVIVGSFIGELVSIE